VKLFSYKKERNSPLRCRKGRKEKLEGGKFKGNEKKSTLRSGVAPVPLPRWGGVLHKKVGKTDNAEPRDRGH